MNASFESGEVAVFATCPSCAYPALRRRSFFEICAICGWEDDGQDDPEFAPHPNYFLPDDVAGGPNHSYSLTEARFNFARYRQMYRPMDKRCFERQNEDRSLREALIAIYSELLPEVNEQQFAATFPRISASFRSISKALSERVRRHELQIHKEREARYRAAYDVLAERFATKWEATKRYFEVTMVAEGRPVGITACKVFPHVQVHGNFSRFLAKTMEREIKDSSFNETECDRWLIIADDSSPPMLDQYREAYSQLADRPFQKVFVALGDGSVADIES